MIEYLQQKRRDFTLLLIIMFLLLLALICLSVSVGAVPIPVSKVWRIIFYKITDIKNSEWSSSKEHIVWTIRFPRTLMAALAGSGLALIGCVMQAIIRNSLADPYILGISSGASSGAALAIITGVFSIFGTSAISVGAFCGAMCAFLLVFVFSSSLSTSQLMPNKLILSGIAVSSLFSAVTSFLMYLAPDENVKQVMFWMMGSVAGARWNDFPMIIVVSIVFMTAIMIHSKALNVILMGEESAITLGINPKKLRRRLFVLMSLMTAVIVARTGTIGFVGLVIPHIIRFFTGSDHHRLLPACVLGGAIFLVSADILARVIMIPREIPIGIISSLVGAPFFIYLLKRSQKSI